MKTQYIALLELVKRFVEIMRWLHCGGLNNASIGGQWAIADAGTLDINGHLVSSLPEELGSNWDNLHAFSINNISWLNPSLNTINLTITKSDLVLEAARFEGSITGVLVTIPEPEIYAMLLAGLGLIKVIARRRKTA
jgi:hypothetical protein